MARNATHPSAWLAVSVFAVGPAAHAGGPGREVTITASPATVLLGKGGPQDVQLVIVVRERGASAADADLVVQATAGRVVDLKEAAAGRFTAVLSAPTEQFPQLAVVTAADVGPVAWGEPPVVGSAVVAFRAALTLRGNSEAGARVAVTVAGERFGPTVVGKDGAFSVPVVVPPGESWGQAVTTDRLGNASRARINLYLPEVDRVHSFVFPAELVADGADNAWIFVTTVSPSGEPEESAAKIEAERGSVGKATRLGVGLRRVDYRAPRGVGDGSDVVRVRAERAKGEETITIPLVAGAPAALEVEVSPDPVPADGATAATVTVTALDAQGDAAGGHRLGVVVEDAALGVKEATSGTWVGALAARARVGQAALTVTLTPQTEICRRGRLAGVDGRVRVVDVRGLPCSGPFKTYDAEHRQTGEGTLGPAGEVGPVELGATLHLELERGRPRRVASLSEGARTAAVLSVTRPVVWRIPTVVEIHLRQVGKEAGAIRVAVDATGVSDLAKRIQVAATKGTVERAVATAERLELTIRGAAPPFDVVATDSGTGVAAWLRVE
ncbi:MAG: hypothetical protein HY903_01370 [Deltaproteobacteria bacterium]|nr:hypothetical protein [Deltaproteobacteria bacterium]